jgi:uncharacterized membrane protein YcgQ (UPF0703/DUF1980 family)
MSLMPIIYTSLVLFFGLLLIVITLSYLTYKTKSRVNPVIAEEVKKRQKNLVVIKRNQYLNNQPQSLLQTNVVSNTVYPSFNNVISIDQIRNIQQSYLNNSSYENERKNNYENNFDDETLHYKPRNRETINRTTSSRSRLTNSRIEIMNETRGLRNNMNPAKTEKSTRRFYSNHADLNLLNFYSDDSDKDFSASSAQYKAV